MSVILEVCAGDWQSVEAANEAGAARIELCTGLEAGGLTPPPSMISRSVRLGGPKVNVLVRPRSGDFVYSEAEKELIEQDIRMARQAGAHGVVIGCLRPDGRVDIETLRRWHDAAEGMSVTFHRAFDLCRDPFEALDDVAPFADRVLTSGLAPTALAGVEMLHRLTDYAGGRTAIMAGGGVNPSNIAEIVGRSGVPEIHGTFSAPVASRMEFRREGVSMSSGGADEYVRSSSSVDKIRAALATLADF